MKYATYLLILITTTFLGYRQYKFNSQLEWWIAYNSSHDRCDWWEVVIPMNIQIEEAVGTYKNGKYAVGLKMWKDNVQKSRREACDKAYKFADLNPYMPHTDDYYKFRESTGLNSIMGYIKDFLRKPRTATNDNGYIEKPVYTVKLKNHWYGGSDGLCYIIYAERIQGAPLPFLSRILYTLSCTNDKVESEDSGGFSATSTADNLEDL